MGIFKNYYGIEEHKLFDSLIKKKIVWETKLDQDGEKVEEKHIIKLSSDEISTNKSLLRDLINKTTKDVIIDYRRSDDFLQEAIKNSKGDKEKLKQYLLISMKYFNYLKYDQKKLKLETLNFDEGLPQSLVEFYLNIRYDQEDNQLVSFFQNY